MRAIIVACLLFPALAFGSDQFYKDVVYKCVKDGKTTYQEIPCGWSSLGDNERKNAEQQVIPFSDFCKDKTISDKNTLRQTCPKFSLPKDMK